MSLRRALEPHSDCDLWEITLSRLDLVRAGLTETIYYGLRAWGPNWSFEEGWLPGSSVGFVSDVDGQGNRFNPNKLLLDPYARELSHDPVSPVNMDWGFYEAGEQRLRDSGPVAPKGIVLLDEQYDVGPRPTRAFKDDLIYEVHLRGLTKNDPTQDASCRGTYRGAIARIPYLQQLGVTAVEFLPLQETNNDNNDVYPGTEFDNYWGYNTYAFFAPDRRYACDQSPGGPTREFTEMVRAFHEADIKVFVDVVSAKTAVGRSITPASAATSTPRTSSPAT